MHGFWTLVLRRVLESVELIEPSSRAISGQRFF